jgi:hypothetical protein
MRAGTLLMTTAMLLVLVLSTRGASAQIVSIEFHDGRVNLVAENATVSSILGEWTRLGRTTFINGDRIPGAPVSLVLEDVPEAEALAVVLRTVSGYMVGARASALPGASQFDRVLIIPTSAPVRSTPPPPPSPAFTPPDDALSIDQDQPESEPAAPAGADRFGGQRPDRGGARGLTGPDVPPLVEPEEATAPQEPPPAPVPGNPFGIQPGSTRPGVISPVPDSAPGAGQGRQP